MFYTHFLKGNDRRFFSCPKRYGICRVCCWPGVFFYIVIIAAQVINVLGVFNGGYPSILEMLYHQHHHYYYHCEMEGSVYAQIEVATEWHSSCVYEDWPVTW